MMEQADILAAFSSRAGRTPRKAIEAAISQREEITPALLCALEQAIEWVCDHGCDDEEAERRGAACHCALYLLAQFRETKAYPLVVKLSRLPEDTLDFIIGDTMTETLDRILASVCGGDSSLIEGLIEDPDVCVYVRAAAVTALKILVAVGAKPRDEVMTYYKSLFNGRLERSYSCVWEDLISCATRLHPEDAYEEIMAAFDDGLVEDFYMAMEDVDKVRRMSREKVLARLATATQGYIEDSYKELRSWGYYDEDYYREQLKSKYFPPKEDIYQRTPPRSHKIGPNDPCTCGSGRKYKKCCGRV